MPANLTPQYRAAEEEYRQASTPQEKMAALRKMLAVMPKHKGTDHLQADLKRRIAKLNQETQKGGRRGRRGNVFRVLKEGAGQVVLIGFPNVGKSSLVDALTNAAPEVAEYPFTTHRPIPGMMYFEDVQIQLVDTAPMTADGHEPWILDLVRGADAALVVTDLGSDDCLDQIETVIEALAKTRIRLVGKLPEEVEETDLNVYRKTIVVANKADLDVDGSRLEMVREFCGNRYKVLPLSVSAKSGLEDFRRDVFDLLDVIRIYSKEPGRPPDMEAPFTIPRGSTVLDLAYVVHKEIAEGLKTARLWGSAKFDGQQVKRDHVLRDKDVVELHM